MLFIYDGGFVLGGFCPRRCLSRGGFVQGGFVLGGFCPTGVLSYTPFAKALVLGPG